MFSRSTHKKDLDQEGDDDDNAAGYHNSSLGTSYVENTDGYKLVSC